MKIHVKTFGCSLNKAESEMLIDHLISQGYFITDNEDEADIVILNTCGVKTPTENKIINLCKKLAEKKLLIIGGCLPKISLKRILDNVKFFGAILGTHMYNRIDEIIERIKCGERKIIEIESPARFLFKTFSFNPVVSIVPIATGCLGNCSYCSVKIARGKIRSRSVEEIIYQIKLSVKSGCKEIWLTAQDTAAYGVDIGETLPNLLHEIIKIKGNFRIRVGMMNPKNILPILDDLILAYKSRKVYKFIHVPVQSGSDKILSRMNRGYSVNDFKNIIKKFRAAYPKLTVSTDIIVGFPGEGEKDFTQSMNLIREIQPDIVNISRFGVRPGSEAEKLDEQLDGKTKKERSRKLTKLVNIIALKRNLSWVGWRGKILISEKGVKGGLIGRNYAYKPILIKTENDIFLGKEIKVEIKEAKSHYLTAVPLSKLNINNQHFNFNYSLQPVF